MKLAAVLIGARFRGKLEIRERSVLNYRVGITDVDMFGELNNARYLNYMERGRWDYSYRTGFVALMKKEKRGIAVGGASIRYRRRIPLLSRFSMISKLVGHDGRWF